jgi:hypothetical protein
MTVAQQFDHGVSLKYTYMTVVSNHLTLELDFAYADTVDELEKCMHGVDTLEVYNLRMPRRPQLLEPSLVWNVPVCTDRYDWINYEDDPPGRPSLHP